MASPPLRDKPNVLSIPAGVSFADTLAAALLRQADGDPLKLAEMTVLLPNRRACRTLAGGVPAPGPIRRSRRRSSASLLPRLMPIGDLDSDDLSVLGGALFGAAADIPPAIGELKRRMLLARLIMAAPAARRFARRHHPPGPGGAAGGGAGAAARPGGDRAQGSVRAGRAGAGKPGASIGSSPSTSSTSCAASWPEILADEGAIDPADRRNRLLDLQRAVWEAAPPTGADHRGRFDRLDPRGRRPHAHHRAPAARRGLSAGARPRAER